ncbi:MULTISPECIES: hypothetical protein [unclassified Pseudoxanthomonas]|uniref:hypothetical protein n=1 Tax=unclassified Pseudoxanthomonas TaxID=2645906 RepID=UPI000A4CA04E|nr:MULTISPECIES: hypothetical protein [unclassified Pseudoxanthomonas]PPJ42907.1 protein tonB [Pseudoxanthomonas sp. KAs_5_3]
MLVTGSILIERDGSVSGLEVDQRDKLPDVVATLVEKSGPAWKFEPVLVEGEPRKVKARMSLLVVANKLEEGGYRVGIRDGYFGKDAMTPEERQQESGALKGLDMKPPSYPMSALEVGARGTAYVVLKIGPDGKVMDAAVEQVNLRTIGNVNEMKRMRSAFSRSTVTAAKNWLFSMSANDLVREHGFTLVRVPVDYEFAGNSRPSYGQWDAYIPGPRETIPWIQDDRARDESPEAMLAGGLYEVGKGLRLLTPLGGGS